MKYLVLCLYGLREPTENDRRAAFRVLEAAGFQNVGFEETPNGLDGALQFAAVGEFRAPSDAVLRERVRQDLGIRLASHGLQVSLSLCIRPSPVADNSAREEIAV